MKFAHSDFDYVFRRKGQVALSLVLIMGAIMLSIGATLVFVVISFLNSTTGFQAANEAMAMASGGVNDALLQLSRDRTFSDAGYCIPSQACGTGTARIVVTQGSPEAGKVMIVSTARIGVRERRIRAIASVSDSGQVDLVSWNLY